MQKEDIYFLIEYFNKLAKKYKDLKEEHTSFNMCGKLTSGYGAYKDSYEKSIPKRVAKNIRFAELESSLKRRIDYFERHLCWLVENNYLNYVAYRVLHDYYYKGKTIGEGNKIMFKNSVKVLTDSFNAYYKEVDSCC